MNEGLERPLITSGGLDLIGDIHGHARPLRALLGQLGYRPHGPSYRHGSGRQVVFLGDLIDRGPEIRETLEIVRAMVDAGDARAIMGNHEFNAICFHTEDGEGDYLRSHRPRKNRTQHAATLAAFADRPGELEGWIEWFKGLPFFLDLGGARAVHATWHGPSLEVLEGKSLRDAAFLEACARRGTPEFDAIEVALKGISIRLPGGRRYTDHRGGSWDELRVRWWESPLGKTYRDVAFPAEGKTGLPDVAVEFGGRQPAWPAYPAGECPVFFGHYWLPPDGVPEPVASNAACLDYSIAGEGGRLVAYRWDGEAELSAGRFVSVGRDGVGDTRTSVPGGAMVGDAIT